MLASGGNISFAIFIYDAHNGTWVYSAAFINANLSSILQFQPGSSHINVYRIDGKLQYNAVAHFPAMQRNKYGEGGGGGGGPPTQYD